MLHLHMGLLRMSGDVLTLTQGIDVPLRNYGV